MKHLFLLLIFIYVITGSANAAVLDTLVLNSCTDLIAAVKKQFVPDGRTDLFSREFTNDTLKVETTSQAVFDELKIRVANRRGKPTYSIGISRIDNMLFIKHYRTKLCIAEGILLNQQA